MEVVSAPAGNGAKQWLSELGLEEPSLVRHLDSLFLPATNQLHSHKGYNYHNSYDLNGSCFDVKQRDTSSNMNNSFSTAYPPQWDALLNPERPAKIPKTNSWDSSILNHLPTSSVSHQPLLPLILNQNKQHQNQTQNSHHQQQQNHMNHYFSPQQQLCQSIDGFAASLPKLSDDVHDLVAPRTPTMEIGGSQVLGGRALDNCANDILAVECMSSTGNRDSSPITDSLRGKRKPEFFSSPTDMRIQRPAPVATTRAPSPPSKGTGHTQDHIMAERKRREKLSQRFIALSAIVPGLKKMDKASVLGDAIKYVKSLQDKVQKLEEQAPKKCVSSIAVVKNGKDSSKGSGSDVEVGGESEVVQSVETPDIEARVNDKNVLIKMHADMKIGCVAKCIAELEKLNLIVINANILSFTNTSVDLTLTAKIEDGHEITADEIVATLQSFFKMLL